LYAGKEDALIFEPLVSGGFRLPPAGVLLPMNLGPNDGGVKRGERTDTGDEEARPNILNDGELPIPEDDAIGTFEEMPDPDANDMEEVTPYNPRSGVTNTGRRPPDDWAANTGPTQTPESIKE
jgi:hypothetical protein